MFVFGQRGRNMYTQLNDREMLVRAIGKFAVLFLILTAAVFKTVPARAETASETAAEAETEPAALKNGWVTENGNTFYYKAGKKLTGWQKIKGKTYYLTKKDGLLKNTIAGSKKKGFAYVDADGVRINDTVMKMAVAFAVKNAGVRKPSQQRLELCFKALRRYPYVRYYGDKPAAGRVSGYAADMLKKKGGNCFRYSSAYAYIARALGFEVRVAAGGTTAFRGRSLSPHGWCEVKIGKAWYIVDCSMARHHTSEDLCLVKRSSYPFKLRCDYLFTMQVVKHKIRWTGEKAPWNNLKSKKLHLK